MAGSSQTHSNVDYSTLEEPITIGGDSDSDCSLPMTCLEEFLSSKERYGESEIENIEPVREEDECGKEFHHVSTLVEKVSLRADGTETAVTLSKVKNQLNEK